MERLRFPAAVLAAILTLALSACASAPDSELVKNMRALPNVGGVTISKQQHDESVDKESYRYEASFAYSGRDTAGLRGALETWQRSVVGTDLERKGGPLTVNASNVTLFLPIVFSPEAARAAAGLAGPAQVREVRFEPGRTAYSAWQIVVDEGTLASYCAAIKDVELPADAKSVTVAQKNNSDRRDC